MRKRTAQLEAHILALKNQVKARGAELLRRRRLWGAGGGSGQMCFLALLSVSYLQTPGGNLVGRELCESGGRLGLERDA